MRNVRIIIALAFIMLFTTGFSLDNAIVPRQEIMSGGPPKDGIPAILDPKFIPADDAAFMNASDTVIGIVVAGVARAYPVKILNWHEAVNDIIGGVPIVISF